MELKDQKILITKVDSGSYFLSPLHRVDLESGRRVCTFAPENADIARRIAACWNACVGFDTDKLEAVGSVTFSENNGIVTTTHHQLSINRTRRFQSLEAFSIKTTDIT